MSRVESFMEGLMVRNPNQPEFHQAVREVVETIDPLLENNPKYLENNILERLTEPDRVFQFRVNWEDDNGNINVNKGYRIQFTNAIGPYKGGLRFHPSVNLSILKFLAFEQIFKNSLTTLPMGGGKGGSDFDPKGKSDSEVMRFCQAFMTELSKYIGPNTDVPAGDIGVGGREIGYMFGQYKKLRSEFTGVLTGKGMEYGGSLIRPEATGYGTVYFAEEMFKSKGDSIHGKTCAVSGSGNVAQYAIEKILQIGGKVVTASDSSGYVYCPSGIHTEKLDFMKELKNVRRGRIKEMAEKFDDVQFFEGERVWNAPCDIHVALPCATQNELDLNDAKTLVDKGLMLVAEGANMPSTPEAIEIFHDAKIPFAPGKASNAGGVATSGLEMSQNSLRYNWTRKEVDQKLHNIMISIHNSCVEFGTEGDYVNYVKGANIAGFKKVADAIIAQGI